MAQPIGGGCWIGSGELGVDWCNGESGGVKGLGGAQGHAFGVLEFECTTGESIEMRCQAIARQVGAIGRATKWFWRMGK